jgi:hypothetical protein
MSTGLECQFIEVHPGEWWYLLESGSAPKMAWDWREYAEAYGPFKDYEIAHEHLRVNHANPGGHSIQEYKAGYEPDAVMTKLMKEAKDREYEARKYRYGYPRKWR